MVSRTLHTGFLALGLLAGHVIAEITTKDTLTPTAFPPSPTSTFISPSLNENTGGLSSNVKIGISIGVTLASILLVGSISILCVIRRRNRGLLDFPADESLSAEDGTLVNNDPKHNHNSFSAGVPSPVHSTTPEGFAHEGEYATMSSPFTPPPSQTPVLSYATPSSGATSPGPAMTYPPSRQDISAGHSYAQYEPAAHIDQQPGTHFPPQSGLNYDSTTQQYPAQSATPFRQELSTNFHEQFSTPFHQDPDEPKEPLSPGGLHTIPETPDSIEMTPIQHDLQISYLQDYQPPASGPSIIIGRDTPSPESTYYVPPPHPNAAELPEQHGVTEIMDDGYNRDAP